MKLTGKEPAYWHDAKGKHTMDDPADSGVPKKHWTGATLDFHNHLRFHEAELARPTAQRHDIEYVKALIAKLDAQDNITRIIGELVDTYRRGIAAGDLDAEGRTITHVTLGDTDDQ